MSDHLRARSPLERFWDQHALPTRHNEAGLIIEERGSFTQFQLIARNHMIDQLSNQVAQYLERERALRPMEGDNKNGLLICATGPREYWILVQKPDAIDALTDIQNIVEQSASVFDQSQGRMVVQLSGPNATQTLAKGTALDLQAQSLPAVGATQTIIEHIPALIAWHSDSLRYQISVPRSYAHSFMTWLCEAALEYGYKAEGR